MLQNDDVEGIITETRILFNKKMHGVVNYIGSICADIEYPPEYRDLE